MKTFSVSQALCEGNSPVTGEFPSLRPVARSFAVLFDLRAHEQTVKQTIRVRQNNGKSQYQIPHKIMSYAQIFLVHVPKEMYSSPLASSVCVAL